ncbi:MAG: catalase [Balneolales bacterium]
MKKKKLSTGFGAPVANNQNSLSAGERGPLLLQDYFYVEKIAHFDRERIPERVVHAKGAGAFGYFEVTDDLTKYSKADFLGKVGKKTDVFLRFSTVGGEKGSADAERDPRGFALKFYTGEGNYDLVGNNTPVFFLQDPVKFPDFIHTQKRNPRTNLKDPNMFWDFISHSPETTHQVTILFSDRGTPKTYRNMNGYGSHTYAWINDEGKRVWVKYHFKTAAGIENFTAEEAQRVAGADPDNATRDLYDHIESGNDARWNVKVQIMPEEDAKTYRFDPFDVTKVWSHKDYPLHDLGVLVLNRNPENYFADVEQAAFSPANLVPGVELSPDKMLQGRVFSYPDTQRHRLGPNYHNIPVNCPYAAKDGVNNYQRDGAMRTDGNGGRAVNYEPNSYEETPKEDRSQTETPFELEGESGRTAYQYNTDNFVQAGDLYRLMTDDQKTRLVHNIVGHMSGIRDERITLRQICNFFRADVEYGTRIAEGLGVDLEEAMGQTTEN